ncbi:leucine-rich repeat-containing protein 3-like isoform X1 [Acanthaster planci]|uniref:Leucine-rich repeat-containing protein 3-like isoform X1 n=1 Tax=Acanthaster planci TaxID=133434 RepID=A0A8B7YN59_ACAPL|nr:leucine-rich repeat-containing protein 3-like isoform X1 [Acanthaster planci]
MDTSIMVCLVLLFTFAASVVAMNSTGDACGVCECIEHLHAVICTGKGLRELPSGIPNDTVSLELGDNFLHEIPYDSLLEFKSLIKINLTNNLIEKPFGLPESVKFLHAEGNRLQDIKPIVKNGIHLKSV